MDTSLPVSRPSTGGQFVDEARDALDAPGFHPPDVVVMDGPDVSSGEDWHRNVPTDPHDVSAVRHAACEFLRVEGYEAVVPDVGTMMGELLANAVMHGEPPRSMRVSADDRVVRVEVSDGGAGEPTVLVADGLRVGGNGLRVVAALSAAWGCEAEAGGKAVWFEYPLAARGGDDGPVA